ncbi:uncharacterized protein TRIADDRAFT_31061 [Trichoplax adhaerens]|uniref:FAD/NAD(P)-binding domain-containing protein n=1 Tax=Trichoplax adhaerens TaxID=10228 RepID=B3S8E7_TRIAD|nr:hypothetical protein TRIADDRAFT_31061 [Trichoplax adhaerens]EDV20869.1 hypothetical protein TRIADDRAFT_31061 [Trichoplax adhaerens]|eukprot:XP_002116513.1 hypothetical protein TRIADDRAFT_31061 [Trichoplax adhaerens]
MRQLLLQRIKLIGFVLYCSVIIAIIEAKTENHDYCVVGSGPGGLQIAYYLESAGRDYVVFEKNDISGSFFTVYPRHRKLISVNKLHTGHSNSEFNLRHDWNSLLSKNQSFLMSQYSREYYPNADKLVEYLNDYAEQFKLKIRYDTDILTITRDSEDSNAKFKMMDSNDNTYICKVAIISTGISVPYVPAGFVGNDIIEGYETVSTNPSNFKGQNVLVLGQGNSGFETAQAISHTANYIHVFGRTRVRLATSTHYIGDVRAINSRHIDSYQLKTLDGILEGDLKLVAVTKTRENRYQIGIRTSGNYYRGAKNARKDYDRVIRCLGFKYDDSIFGENAKPIRGRLTYERYPMMKGNFESSNVDNMYFAGSMAHYLDYRRSGGGSIQGIRYNARALHRILEWRYHKIPWPAVTFRVNALIDHVITRINQASGLYQMFDSLIDVILIQKRNRFQYLEEVPVGLLPNLEELTGRKIIRGFITLHYKYGKNFSNPDTDTLGERLLTYFAKDGYKCKYHHPVIGYYKKPFTGNIHRICLIDGTLPQPDKLFHVLEDFLTEWYLMDEHVFPLKKFLENIINKDLNNYFSDSCYEVSIAQALHRNEFCF